jgi:hypothetical protein
VNVDPAMVSVPLRVLVVAFAATLKPTVPEPDPDAPEVIVIHGAPLVAFHTQPADAVTVLLPVPPAAVNDCERGDATGMQGAPPKENVLVRTPPLRPPDPIASTIASYVTPV